MTKFKDKLWDILSDATTVNADGKIGAFSQEEAYRQILTAIDEVIGEDEFVKEATEYWQPARIKNQLRAEIRHALGIPSRGMK